MEFINFKVMPVCAICKYYHNFRKCPLIFFAPNKSTIYLENKKKSILNNRSYTIRQKLKE